MHDCRLETMQGKKRSHEEADISQPPLQACYRLCLTCYAWKWFTDGDSHMIRTSFTPLPFGFDYEFQWHCNACWQLKNPKDTKAEKDKDADKDEDKDDKDEDKDGKDAPSKKKDAVGTSQPCWPGSTHFASI